MRQSLANMLVYVVFSTKRCLGDESKGSAEALEGQKTGRRGVDAALSGLRIVLPASFPRALPWAFVSVPFRHKSAGFTRPIEATDREIDRLVDEL